MPVGGYALSESKTLSEARNNIRAFSEGAATSPQPEGFVPITTQVQITECLGWTEFKESAINSQLVRGSFERPGVSGRR